jgi:molecular chaperone GrpE
MQSTESDNPSATPLDAEIGARIAELEAALATARNEQLRLLAEMENQRKRLVRDAESARKYGAERVMGDLLSVVDSLEAGLKAADNADVAKLVEGKSMTLRLLTKALESNGLVVVEPAGQPFDPALHQAVSMVPSAKHPPGTVVNTLQKGYVLNDRLLRPAMVAVAAEPDPPEDA